MNRGAYNRYREFMRKLNGCRHRDDLDHIPIENFITDVVPYFEIQHSISPRKGETLAIHLQKDSIGHSCFLTIQYNHHKNTTPLKQGIGKFASLPEEICRYIEEYTHEHLYLKLKVTFPQLYPYVPASWSLEDIQNYIPYNSEAYGDMTLREYYEYLVQCHNEKYRELVYINDNLQPNWSPATTLENDILLLISRIHPTLLYEALCPSL